MPDCGRLPIGDRTVSREKTAGAAAASLGTARAPCGIVILQVYSSI